MGCRIGMSTNVPDRVARLISEGLVPRHATYRTLQSGMSYNAATALEEKERNKCGAHCQGNPGGGYVPGYVWSVYRIDW